MDNVELMSKTIKEIVELQGTSVFRNSKIFCAMLDDLVPRLEKERKIFRRVLDDEVLAEIGHLYEGTTIKQNKSWPQIKWMLKENCGIQEEWCDIITHSFSSAFISLELDELFRKAEKGDVKAQVKLGVMYEDGDKLEKDYVKAFQLFGKAAEQGDADAQYKLACMYDWGHGVGKDTEKALEWYEKAAIQGNVEAQNYLGSNYFSKKDYEKAFMWYRKAAEQGNGIGQMRLAKMYRDGDGIGNDYKKAMEWYKKAATQGYGYAQLWIGYMYYSGMGIEKDDEKAMEWYKKAVVAPVRVTTAFGFFQSVLGYMKKKGNKKENIVEALEWYGKAAEHGCAYVQTELGNIYRNSFGVGIITDDKKALEWYQKAAAQGDAYAQHSAGNMYYLGKGAEKDYAKAFLLYKKAAEQGRQSVWFILGSMYEKGEGTKKDINAALYWYRKVADEGDVLERGLAKEKLREYSVS